MATTKNITMKQFNGTDYDTLYPKTVYNQVSGVAPAGYGLGANTGKLITDGNDALVGGWFYWENNDTNLPFTYGHMRVDPRLSSTSGQILMQTAYSDSYPGCVAQRKMIDGAFKPWEWVNPPMMLGVEYRTTERYFGKPVYTQVISIGAIGSGSGNVEHGIPDISVVVGLIGTNSYGPTLNTHPYMTVFYANSQYVRWETTQAISGTSYAVLRYTKTTD